MESELAKKLLETGYKSLLDPDVLAIQSDFFTSSTSNEYARLLDKLNQGAHFDQEFYDHFYPLIGVVPMNNEGLKRLVSHMGVSQHAYLTDKRRFVGDSE